MDSPTTIFAILGLLFGVLTTAGYGLMSVAQHRAARIAFALAAGFLAGIGVELGIVMRWPLLTKITVAGLFGFTAAGSLVYVFHSVNLLEELKLAATTENPRYSEYWLNELQSSAEETRGAFCSDWPIQEETRSSLEAKAKRFSRVAEQFADNPRVKRHIADASEPLPAMAMIYGYDVERTGKVSEHEIAYYEQSRKILSQNLLEIEKSVPLLRKEQSQ